MELREGQTLAWKLSRSEVLTTTAYLFFFKITTYPFRRIFSPQITKDTNSTEDHPGYISVWYDLAALMTAAEDLQMIAIEL